MNLVEAALSQISADLLALHQDWALIGGFAVSVRCEPRFTRDVDIAVAVADDQTAEALVRALMSRRYRVLATVEQYVTGRLATVRLAPPFAPADQVVVDLLYASSGVEQEIVAGADVIEVLPALCVPVAGVGDLIALKLLARNDAMRPQDAVDLHAMRTIASRDDFHRAATLVQLIASRGYDRGIDLRAAMRAYEGSTAER